MIFGPDLVGSFLPNAISVKRLDKCVPLTSKQIEIGIGSYVQEKTKAQVNLTNYDHNVEIEIVQNEIFLCTNKIKCFAGLPVGIEGTVLALIENQVDILAALLMLKRGCDVIPILRDNLDLNLLEKFSHGHPHKHILIKELKEIPNLLEKHNAKALVLAQTFKTYSDLDLNIPILRPLIGFNQTGIEKRIYDFTNM